MGLAQRLGQRLVGFKRRQAHVADRRTDRVGAAGNGHLRKRLGDSPLDGMRPPILVDDLENDSEAILVQADELIGLAEESLQPSPGVGGDAFRGELAGRQPHALKCAEIDDERRGVPILAVGGFRDWRIGLLDRGW
jgi:hypothetical protein